MNDLSPRVYKEILRLDLGYFAQHCFCELNPQAAFLPNWHIEVIAAKLAAVREGKIRRLIINLPPRHLKSLLARSPFRPGIWDTTLRRRSSASAMPGTSRTSSPAIAAAS